jgi:hypothetical protein
MTEPQYPRIPHDNEKERFTTPIGSFRIDLQFWRDPVKRIGTMTRTTFTAQPRLVLASMSFTIELLWSGHNL